MKTIPCLLPVTTLLLGAMFACSPESKMAHGFVLPEGDIEAGKTAFVALKCTTCHEVDGVDLEGAPTGSGVVIGGEVRRIKTYGELVTAVINPQHELSAPFNRGAEEGAPTRSPMPDYSRDMTVKHLQDIVAFLHSRYRETGPEFADYPLMMP